MNLKAECVIATLLLLPFQLFADDIDTSESVVFRLYVNSKLWGQVTVLCEKSNYYLNITELLTILEYKYEIEPEKQFFRGFLSETDSTYIIHNNSINGKKTNEVGWNESHELFVDASLIARLYQFENEFILNSLSLNIKPKNPIPAVIRQLREEKLLKIKRDKEERQLTNIDTTATRHFKLNALGYSLNTNIGTNNSELALQGNINGELLKGCFIANYNYSTQKRHTNDNMTFNWIKPYLDKKWLKTARVYHDNNNLQISTDSYVTGVMLSNTNSTSEFRKGHTYQGRTLPNADVEIYNNGQLIRYLKADSLGNYQLDIPSYDGDNKIKAISYDSFGKPMVDESVVYMPPGLQEKNKLIYYLSSGITNDGYLFIAPSAEYGLTKFLTLALGNETLFRYGDIGSIVILGVKYAFRNRLRVDLNYIPSVKWNAMLSGNIRNFISGNMSYERFNDGQKIIYNAPSEKFIVNINGGIPLQKISGNYYANVQYYKYGKSESYASYFGINFWWRKMTTNFSVSTNSQKIKFENPTFSLRLGYMPNQKWYNELSIDYRNTHRELSFRNRLNYQFKNKFTSFIELEYKIKSKRYNTSCGIAWRLPWAQLRAGFNNNRYNTSTYMNISGSVALHDMDNITLSDRFVGGGSLLVVLFADLNGDGKYNPNEPILNDAKVILRTGADVKKTSKGLLYTNISPNNAFKITIPRQSFSDITWQIEQQDKCLVLAPYQSRTLYFPVRILTELAGQVTTLNAGQKVGVAGLMITITHRDSGKVTKLHSDDWGYYTFMGVCGTYTIEAEQCDKIHRILINGTAEGEQIDNLNFETKENFAKLNVFDY